MAEERWSLMRGSCNWRFDYISRVGLPNIVIQHLASQDKILTPISQKKLAGIQRLIRYSVLKYLVGG